MESMATQIKDIGTKEIIDVARLRGGRESRPHMNGFILERSLSLKHRRKKNI